MGWRGEEDEGFKNFFIHTPEAIINRMNQICAMRSNWRKLSNGSDTVASGVSVCLLIEFLSDNIMRDTRTRYDYVKKIKTSAVG